MKNKHTTIMIKQDLKDRLDAKMIQIGKKLSYAQIIEFLLEDHSDYLYLTSQIAVKNELNENGNIFI